MVASLVQIYQPPVPVEPYQAEGLRPWGSGLRARETWPGRG